MLLLLRATVSSAAQRVHARRVASVWIGLGLGLGLSAAEPVSTPGSVPTAPAATAAAAPAILRQLDAPTLEKRVTPILKELALKESDREATVKATLMAHFQALQAWHADHDAELAALWARWAEARSGEKDENKAAGIGRDIDRVYASFQPEHAAFLASLAVSLSARQIDTVKDVLTRSPGLKRTYDAYLQIVPHLTEADKTFIFDKLRVAREHAMDAITNKEKANLFKRQKVQIEAYIDAKGYDWKKSYAAYVARLEAEKKH
ncbi:MAG: DUF3826 domain-containing protein [Opitutaceae bacterium]|nr:DUF3826 domain-containing protein [Opitutaceae bacterium]